MTVLNSEMMRALEADGEKLRRMTGEDHGPFFPDALEDFAPAVEAYEPTGSRVICNPPPMDTDQDFIALTYDDATTRERMECMGYTIEGSPEFYTGNDHGGFRSYRKGEVNVIITPDPKFYDLFRSATELARRFNLTSKPDRIALFQVVLYGVKPESLA